MLLLRAARLPGVLQVVDASGTTDREGRAAEAGEGADPLDDVE